jgi:hypothetical protein
MGPTTIRRRIAAALLLGSTLAVGASTGAHPAAAASEPGTTRVVERVSARADAGGLVVIDLDDLRGRIKPGGGDAGQRIEAPAEGTGRTGSTVTRTRAPRRG